MDKLLELSSVLAKIGDAALLERFFREILTSKEVRDISSRWELVKLLEAGVSQREIARKLGLSLCKITRGSRELKKNDSAMRLLLNARAGEGG
jgi:TrpR family trp operon transcriptional repressor